MKFYAGRTLLRVARIARDGFAFQDQAIVPFDARSRVGDAGESGGEGDALRLVAGEAHNDHLIRGGGKYFACISGPLAIGDTGDGRIQIQFAAVIGHLGMGIVGKAQLEQAERLIGGQTLRGGNDGPFGERLGFVRHPCEQQAAHFGQILPCFGIIPVALFAGPDGVLVQLDLVAPHASEHHAAQASVADGERLIPIGRCLAIP